MLKFLAGVAVGGFVGWKVAIFLARPLVAATYAQGVTDGRAGKVGAGTIQGVTVYERPSASALPYDTTKYRGGSANA